MQVLKDNAIADKTLKKMLCEIELKTKYIYLYI